jgi:hypothetical protein
MSAPTLRSFPVEADNVFDDDSHYDSATDRWVTIPSQATSGRSSVSGNDCTVAFTRTDSPGVHIATRTATDAEAMSLAIALARLSHVASVEIR